MTDNQDNVATKVDAAAGSPNMAPATVVWLVARREMWAKLRDKGFLLSTGFILVAILASAILPAALSDDSPTYDVGVVEAAVDGNEVIVDSELDPSLERILNGANAALASGERLAEAGIDPNQVSQALPCRRWNS